MATLLTLIVAVLLTKTMCGRTLNTQSTTPLQAAGTNEVDQGGSTEAIPTTEIPTSSEQIQTGDFDNHTSSLSSAAGTGQHPQTTTLPASHLLNEPTFSAQPITPNTYVAYYTAVMTLTGIGYAAVLPTVWRHKRPSSVLLLSLAAADIYVAFVIVPLKINEIVRPNKKTETYCRLSHCMTIYALTVSVYNLLAVAVDRLLAIRYAIWYRVMVQKSHYTITCISLWLASLLTCLPVAGIGVINKTDFAGVTCRFNDTFSIEYLLSFTVVGILLPVSTFLVIQVLLIIFITMENRKHHELTKNGNGRYTNKANQHRFKRFIQEKKIQNMFLAIKICFFICWTPTIYGSILGLVQPQRVTPHLILFIRVMTFSNSFVNPFIFTLLHGDLRKSLISKFKRIKSLTAWSKKLDIEKEPKAGSTPDIRPLSIIMKTGNDTADDKHEASMTHKRATPIEQATTNSEESCS